MKTEYVFALSILLCCLVVGSGQSENLQESSDSNAIDNRSVSNKDVTPPVRIPSPSELIGPSPSELLGVQKPTKPDENVPLVIKLPSGGIALPSGEVIGVQKTANSPPVTTNNEPARLPSATAFGAITLFATGLGALGLLAWRKKRKALA
jgi:hypothetical protein